MVSEDLETFKRRLNAWLKDKHNAALEKEMNAQNDFDAGYYQNELDLTEKMRYLFCKTNNITSEEVTE